MPDKMAELLHRMRAHPPLCRVCAVPCDPDTQVDDMVPVFIMVPLDAQGDQQGIIPVHTKCRPEAEDRLKQAQAVVNLRRVREGTEAPYDKAKRLIDEGKATPLDG